MNKRLTFDTDLRSKTHMQKFPQMRKTETSKQNPDLDRRFTTLTNQPAEAESEDGSF